MTDRKDPIRQTPRLGLVTRPAMRPDPPAPLLVTRKAVPADVLLWEGRRREAPLFLGETAYSPLSLADLLVEHHGVVIGDYSSRHSSRREVPVALLGCASHRAEGYGEIWVLTTRLFERCVRQVVKEAKLLLPVICELDGLTYLTGNVRVGDAPAQKFAELIGFRPTEDIRDYPGSPPYCVYEWRHEGAKIDG